MTQGQALSLRPATMADARTVWAWRNDPASRAKPAMLDLQRSS